MNKQTKKWINSTLAVGMLASGLVMGGGFTAEASSLSTTRTSYTNPYDQAQEKNATYYVSKAEQSKSLRDVSVARGYVSKLKPSSTKYQLEKRLNTLEGRVKYEINRAFSMISKAVQTKLPEDIYSAKKYSSVVKDPDAVKKLNYQLDRLENILLGKATGSVYQAEKTNLRADISKARQEVGYLNQSSMKTSLNNRLDAVERKVQNVQSQAYYYVSKLEKTYDKRYVSPAKKYASIVAEPSVRDSLMKRISKVESQIKLQDYATFLVTTAEKTKRSDHVLRAYSVVNKLENVKVKSELMYRLKAISNDPIVVRPTPVPKPGVPAPTDPIVYLR